MVTSPPGVAPDVPNGITVKGSRGPCQLCSQHLVAGPLVATVMLGSTQSEVGVCSPGEGGVPLPRKWIKAST